MPKFANRVKEKDFVLYQTLTLREKFVRFIDCQILFQKDADIFFYELNIPERNEWRAIVFFPSLRIPLPCNIAVGCLFSRVFLRLEAWFEAKFSGGHYAREGLWWKIWNLGYFFWFSIKGQYLCLVSSIALGEVKSFKRFKIIYLLVCENETLCKVNSTSKIVFMFLPWSIPSVFRESDGARMVIGNISNNNIAVKKRKPRKLYMILKMQFLQCGQIAPHSESSVRFNKKRFFFFDTWEWEHRNLNSGLLGS